MLTLPSCRRWSLTATLFLASASVAYADVLPPPTFVADYLWLGPTLGPIVGLAVTVGVVLLYRRMRKAGKGRGRAAALGLVLFVGANLLCYLLALGNRRPPDHDPLPPTLGDGDGTSGQGNPR